ncbi:MAG: hypothetical protein P8Z37_07135 [Acidobacteriota bacterium]
MNPSFWRLLRHLPKFIRLVFRLLTDRRVPLLAKIAVCSSVAYLTPPEVLQEHLKEIQSG